MCLGCKGKGRRQGDERHGGGGGVRVSTGVQATRPSSTPVPRRDDAAAAFSRRDLIARAFCFRRARAGLALDAPRGLRGAPFPTISRPPPSTGAAVPRGEPAGGADGQLRQRRRESLPSLLPLVSLSSRPFVPSLCARALGADPLGTPGGRDTFAQIKAYVVSLERRVVCAACGTADKRGGRWFFAL